MSFRPVHDPVAPALTALVCMAFLWAGCSTSVSRGGAAYQAPVTYVPLDGSVGRVANINERLRFVVLDYTLNTIPPPGTTLVLYRSTNMVGELKLTTWRTADTAIADLMLGTPEIGDEARPQ
jgi:hypothetical protein